MLEGFYVQLKTVHIKISKEAKSSKARTKFRRILIETKKKVLQTIDLLNSKYKDLPISYEYFNQVSYADKYHVVDCWILLQIAKEEVELTKIEMINYIRFLTDKRASQSYVLRSMIYDIYDTVLQLKTPRTKRDEINCCMQQPFNPSSVTLGKTKTNLCLNSHVANFIHQTAADGIKCVFFEVSDIYNTLAESDPNRCLAYMPRSGKFTVPPCVFEDKASAEEQYHRTFSILHSTIHAKPNGNKKCEREEDAFAYRTDSWIFNPNLMTLELVPFQLIQSHTGNGLAADSAAEDAITVEPCLENT
ncbi:hypothetical protein OUZ56_017209 [Daphnia magna]|uniref:Cc8L18.2-like protein n=1 Tax=Daphnia magna TaxID=35525 RepID=A0ABR0ASH7_9CRUS|nr:hypothetical protein OUZ56_017209 [Daphnia magna]